MKLRKPLLYIIYSKNLTKHFFNRRVTNTWNALPHSVIEDPSLNVFKNCLDKHWDKLDINAALAKDNPFTANGGYGTEFH